MLDLGEEGSGGRVLRVLHLARHGALDSTGAAASMTWTSSNEISETTNNCIASFLAVQVTRW